MPPTKDYEYYQHTRHLPVAAKLGYHARLQVYRLFLDWMRPDGTSRILDLGVTDEHLPIAANILERLYPYPQRLVCAGISDGEAIQAAYPGVTYVRITPGAPLPFADQQFDIVYSNAVLEHVGGFERQVEFVEEACRVGRGVFIVVPNRLFPVEVHTGIPLIHYLPKRWFRWLLRPTSYRFWASEDNLNYVSPDELRRMYPKSRVPEIRFAGIGFGCFRSNIVSFSNGVVAG